MVPYAQPFSSFGSPPKEVYEWMVICIGNYEKEQIKRHMAQRMRSSGVDFND